MSPEATTSIESIEKKLCAEIESILSLNPGAITPDTNLPALGITSLDFVGLMLAIEHKFGVNLLQKGIKIQDPQSPRTLASAIKAHSP
jgi:acyl carrier protein